MQISRDKYLKKIISYKDNGRVKIITGIRRCGKSYLLKELYKNYLIESGVDENHIIIISLDDYEYNNLLNPDALNKYVRSLVVDKLKYYVIIDEIQNVIEIKNPIFTNGKIIKATKNDEDRIGFVQIVMSLMKISNVDLYITGSNSKFLSKDIITEFRDRGDEIHVMPLSFIEFIQEYDDYEKAYMDYSKYGGLPMVLSYDNPGAKMEYLKDLYLMTYSADVMERNKFKNSIELDSLTKIAASNIGSLTNPSVISNTFKSAIKLDVGRQSVYNYLEALEDAYLLYKVGRIDIRGKKHIGATYKYYYSDLGIRNYLVDFLHSDDGHVMENIIYNELKYRGYTVEVGCIESFSKDANGKSIRKNYETDFVCQKGGMKCYIQSAYNLYDETKLEQECKSLSIINDSFKKIIVTRQSTNTTFTKEGIRIVGIIEFLLDESILE